MTDKKTPDEFFAKWEKKEARRIKREARSIKRKVAWRQWKYVNQSEIDLASWIVASILIVLVVGVFAFVILPLMQKA